ncbi:MAG: hypothetical protein KGL53_09895 [Elusimicrobia bacterium]|nr:hypothetical protein [Elusimicrobiota bacterium]
MRARRLLSVLLALLAAAWAAPARAATPNAVNFQGRLADPRTGNPVAGPTAAVTFSVYDAASAGTLLWSEDQTVNVDHGEFEARLGSVVPLSSAVFSAAGRWLEVTADGETLSPREPFASSPYALRAAVADSLEPGSTSYIQVRDTLQSGAVLYVSSFSVDGTLTVYGLLHSAGETLVGGTLRAGTGAAALTTAAGLLDASQLDPATTVPNLSLDASSVTKHGNAVDGPNGFVRLDAAGLVPAARLDSSLVTKQGNAFNAAGKLLQLDSSGLVPNALIDASSIVLRSPSGPVHDYLLDSSSITLQGNTFNGPSQLVKLSGAGLVPNALIDASSIVLRSPSGYLQNYQLDATSVTLQGNAFNAANELVRLDSNAAFTAPASGASVYSVTTSSSINVTGTGAKVRENGSDLMPMGAIIIWTGSACPTGWSEVTALQGRAPVGNCSGCTVGTTAGAAFTVNSQTITHDHNTGATGGVFRSGGTSRTSVVDVTTPYMQVLFCSKNQ